MTKQVRDWVSTLYNKEHIEKPENIYDEHDDTIQYARWQVEQCPKTGKLHIQCFTIFKRSIRLGTISRMLPGGHHEPRSHGSRKQCDDYCSKDESRVAGPWRLGDPMVVEMGGGQGRRSDIHDFILLVETGTSVRDALDEHMQLLVRYPRGIDRLQQHLLDREFAKRPSFDAGIQVYCHWGDAGSGKTRGVFERAQETGKQVYQLFSAQPEWWDGYNGEEIILIDDYYGGFKYSRFLQLTDKYKMRVPIKGGSLPLLHQELHFTSNVEPTEWYRSVCDLHPEARMAIRRRFTKIIHYQRPFDKLQTPCLNLSYD